MTQSIGQYPEPITAYITQGDRFGPNTDTLSNPDGTPFDLTGCQLIGGIKRNAADVGYVAAFTFARPAQTTDRYTFELAEAATAGLKGTANENDLQSRYYWHIKLIDAAGRKITLHQGDARVRAL